MPDDCSRTESHLFPTVAPTCKPDWEHTVYPLQAHALEKPVKPSANTLGTTGRHELVEDGLENDTSKIANHLATDGDLSSQRLDTEHGNGRQESSDTSSLADGIDSVHDESEADIFENGDVPPSLIYESADLSECHSEGIPDNFEDLLNAEASLPFIHNLPDASFKDNQEYTPQDHCLAIQAENPLYEPADGEEVQSTPIHLEQEHVGSSCWGNQQSMINIDDTKHTPEDRVRQPTCQDSRLTINTNDAVSSPQASPLMSNHMLLHPKRTKRRSIALSAKKDLTPEDIEPVAALLIPDDANSALKLNCNKSPLIQRLVTTLNALEECVAAAFDQIASLPKRESDTRILFWTAAYVQLAQAIAKFREVAEAHRCSHHLPSYRTREVTTRNAAEERVTAAFDQIASLPKRDPNARLLRRTAYFQLAQAITELKVAEVHIYPHHLPSYRMSENTIASDAYLKVKGRSSSILLSRGQLSEYARVAERWNDICSSSHLLLTELSAKAETIINNNSILTPSLKALAAQIWHSHPWLLRQSIEHGEIIDYIPKGRSS